MITKSVLIGICALMRTLVHSRSDFSSTIDFQTFELDGHVHDILWCGANDETILVHTDDGGIFRSRDRGANWKRLRSLMQKQGQAVADVDQDVSSFFSLICWQQIGKVHKVVQSPVDDQLIVFLGKSLDLISGGILRIFVFSSVLQTGIT